MRFFCLPQMKTATIMRRRPPTAQPTAIEIEEEGDDDPPLDCKEKNKRY